MLLLQLRLCGSNLHQKGIDFDFLKDFFNGFYLRITECNLVGLVYFHHTLTGLTQSFCRMDLGSGTRQALLF